MVEEGNFEWREDRWIFGTRSVHGPFPHTYIVARLELLSGRCAWPRVVRSRAPDSGSRITGHGSIQRETPMHNLRGISRNLAWPTGSDRSARVSKRNFENVPCPWNSPDIQFQHRSKSDYSDFCRTRFSFFKWKLLNDPRSLLLVESAREFL